MYFCKNYNSITKSAILTFDVEGSRRESTLLRENGYRQVTGNKICTISSYFETCSKHSCHSPLLHQWQTADYSVLCPHNVQCTYVIKKRNNHSCCEDIMIQKKIPSILYLDWRYSWSTTNHVVFLSLFQSRHRYAKRTWWNISNFMICDTIINSGNVWNLFFASVYVFATTVELIIELWKKCMIILYDASIYYTFSSTKKMV